MHSGQPPMYPAINALGGGGGHHSSPEDPQQFLSEDDRQHPKVPHQTDHHVNNKNE